MVCKLWDRWSPCPATLTHGYIIIGGVGEAQQQLWPLAAKLVGLVLGFQLHLCRAREEMAMKLLTRPVVPSHPSYRPPTVRTAMPTITEQTQSHSKWRKRIRPETTLTSILPCREPGSGGLVHLSQVTASDRSSLYTRALQTR